MKRFWQITNILSVIFAIVANYLIGSQLLGLPSITEISAKYETLLSPASYAFSIWGVIYALLVVFAIYQARDLFKPNAKNTDPQQIGPFFIIANILNGLWTYIFVSDIVWLSVIVLVLLTISLYVIMMRTRMAVYQASFSKTVCMWWPLLLYTGWVTIATVVNIASWLESVSISLTTFWAIVTLIVVTVGLLTVLLLRNVRELVLASTWGILAIGVQQLEGDALVSIGAFTVSALLLTSVLVHAFIHKKAFFKLLNVS